MWLWFAGGADVRAWAAPEEEEQVDEEVVVYALPDRAGEDPPPDAFLGVFPLGRSYQTAVLPIAGATAIGGDPTLGAGGANEITFLLDTFDITDPVTGTASLQLPLGAIQQVEILTAGVLPEIPPAAGPVVNLVTTSGHNNLSTSLGLGRTARVGPDGPLTASRGTGTLRGPLVHDKMWALVAYDFDGTSVSLPGLDRTFSGHSALAKITTQPTVEHRITLVGAADTAWISHGPPDAPLDAHGQSSALGTASWQWFPSPLVNLLLGTAAQEQRIAGEARRREQAHAVLSFLSGDDPLGGTHDLKLGADIERIAWRDLGPWTASWLGQPAPSEGALARVGAYVQDHYAPHHHVTVDLGTRLDGALGRAQLGPRLSLAWDPLGRGMTRLVAGAGRRYGRLGTASATLAPDAGLPRLDEILAIAEHEVLDNVAASAEVVLRAHSDLPAFGGGTTEQRSWSTKLSFQKVMSRRWTAMVAWRWAGLIDRGAPEAEGRVEDFARAIDGFAVWSLPTDPWGASIALAGGLYSDRLQCPEEPWRPTGGVRLAQAIPLRVGQLLVELEARYVSVLDDPGDLRRWVRSETPLLEEVGWGGPRVDAGLRYEF